MTPAALGTPGGPADREAPRIDACQASGFGYRCERCGREFRAPRQAFLEHNVGRHEDACTGPKGPPGRPATLTEDAQRRILELRAGGLGLRAIARTLTAEGVPTAAGGRWHASTVRAVLASRVCP